MPATRIRNTMILAAFLLSVSQTGMGNGYVAIEEHLDTYLPDSLLFMTEDSVPVNLREMTGSLPTVISPVYYDCPGLCTPIMNGLATLLKQTDLEIGKDFRFVNISFNESENPYLAAVKKSNYMELANDEMAARYWNFLTGNRKTIDGLLDCLGYSVIRNGKDILHPAAIVIVSPGGKITKYMYGTSFNPMEFKMAIREAARERSVPTITKLLKICFNYEPAGDIKQRHLTIIVFIFMLGAALTLFFVYPPVRNKNL